ncbi:MAG: hypothetical protein GPJ54_18890 [Candidatus Heimdallarchaeota archaeon]|nr:hypothetical protein [Candidatus Heimdallarchaeota archaeon]
MSSLKNMKAMEIGGYTLVIQNILLLVFILPKFFIFEIQSEWEQLSASLLLLAVVASLDLLGFGFIIYAGIQASQNQPSNRKKLLQFVVPLMVWVAIRLMMQITVLFRILIDAETYVPTPYIDNTAYIFLIFGILFVISGLSRVTSPYNNYCWFYAIGSYFLFLDARGYPDVYIFYGFLFKYLLLPIYAIYVFKNMTKLEFQEVKKDVLAHKSATSHEIIEATLPR